jgi:hypothetical protein
LFDFDHSPQRAFMAQTAASAHNERKVVMQSEDILFDLFKRNLDTRRTVIIAVLATVTAFGAWVIQQVTAEKPLFNFETPVGWIHFVCSTFGVAVAWCVYLYMIKNLDYVIDTTLDRLAVQAKLPEDDKTFVSVRLNKSAKWVPLFLGVVIWIALAGADLWRSQQHTGEASSARLTRMVCTPG